MSKVINFTGSYTQDKRHETVSERFNPIQASQVGLIMNSHGLNVVSISTGKARHTDKIDHQRTLSRFRGPEIAEDTYLDIVLDNKHMGRGVSRLHVGIFRVVCTNGLFTGTSFFNHDIRHSGDTYKNLDLGIVAALKTQDNLTEIIAKMKATHLFPEQREFLALEAVKMLTPVNALYPRHRLLNPNRESDNDSDLWTTFNLVQENSMAGKNIVYTIGSLNDIGQVRQRQMVTRTIKPNSAKDLEFNQAFFDLALKLVA